MYICRATMILIVLLLHTSSVYCKYYTG